MEFALERFNDKFKEEVFSLSQSHYKEVAPYDDIPISVNWNIFSTADSAGILRIFTIRDNGKLCGYSIFVVCKSPHFSTSLQATQDLIFIDERIRKGFTGIKFIKWCDEELRKEGVQVVNQHVKEIRDFSKILERMGYKLMDKVYSRRLDYV